jgi:predicted DNA binding protein
MTVSGRFHVPVGSFPLSETLRSNPDVQVKLVRVTISPDLLSPYLWMSAENESDVQRDVMDDPTVSEVTKLDEFNGASLYRLEWSELARELTAPLRAIEGTVLETVGGADGWRLSVNFPTRDAFTEFRTALRESDVDFRTLRLSSGDSTHTGEAFDLTPKQTTALLSAWEHGYFEVPKRTTLERLAAELGISQQSLSERLVRGYAKLVRNTLATPDKLELDGERSASDPDSSI